MIDYSLKCVGETSTHLSYPGGGANILFSTERYIMRIKNNRIAQEMSRVNGLTVCVFAAVSLVFAVITLIFGTDGDVYRLHVYPKLFVSMFCYSLVFVSHMLFFGAYVGVCAGSCGCERGETVIYGISSLVCSSAAIPLMFQTDAFFYAFLLLFSSACFYLMLTLKTRSGGGLFTLLALLCGGGTSYMLYISFSLMLLN